MLERFIKYLKKLLVEDMLTTVNYNQPPQIDGKKNICYYYEISENTEVEIVDDLKAVNSPIIYDIYWQNTDGTSELTFSHNGLPLSLQEGTSDLNVQNHVVFIRHPKSSGNGIGTILQSSTKALSGKRTDI